MKRIFTLLMALCFLLGKSFSQSCISLDCAASHTGITTDGTLASQPFTPPASGCFIAGYTAKQIFWEFGFAPAGGVFTQTFHPEVPGDNLDIDWAVYQIPGGVPPTSVHCPIDPSAWIEQGCSTTLEAGTDSGPGVDGAATIDPNRYFAVAIIVYQGLDNGGLASYAFDMSTPQIDGVDMDATNCPLILLPVKLSSFGAQVNNCAVNLNWTAQAESDFKDYEVQYSSDGANFKTIGTLPGSLNSGSTQNYSFIHTPEQGKVFYRLKMSDIDGNVGYSKTIAMRLNCSKTSYTVYPNPVKDILNVNITNTQSKLIIAKLFDNNGKLISTTNMISGTNVINTAGLAQGIYMLQIITDTETQNMKIIK